MGDALQIHLGAPSWSLIALAFSAATAPALAFYLARGPDGRVRTAAWIASSTVVAFSPCLIPPAFRPLRFAASLVAITMLVKLYDLYREPQLAGRMTFRSYAAYLPNGFWLVLRRVPGRAPAGRDLRHLATAGPAGLLSVCVAGGLWMTDWSDVPFILQHALKASSVFLAVVLLANASAAVWRCLGGRAIDPMREPYAARTPANFWRRWNRPAQQFFAEYTFNPAGGARRPIRATLATFLASGLVHEYVLGVAAGRFVGDQLLFFSIHGCAAAATVRIRPKGRAVPLWIVATALFNLSTSMLFFRSVDAVLPFYAAGHR